MLYEYDATKDKCPLPLVKLRLLLKKMRINDTCLIRITDQGSKNDIPNLLNKKGFKFKEQNIDNDIVELLIHK